MSKKIIKTLLWFLFLVGVASAILHYQYLKDLYLSMTFEPSSEVSAIKDKLDLTDEGKLIFLASAPTINSAEDFNATCNATSSDISTLGCYTNQKIYIYDVNSSELKGIKESTSAHELLHAIWFRLSTADRENLIPTLESVYEKSDATFKKTLETYDSSAKTEEIYVRSATQIKDLPELLETHYAKYFKDQDKIVDYYNSYIEPFNKIKSELETLKSEMDTLSAQISAKEDEYNQRDAVLSEQITEFNRCASEEGCFSSDAEFHTRRSELIAEQSALSDLLDSINADIEVYNEKINLYNENVIHGNKLTNLVNSNPISNEEIAE